MGSRNSRIFTMTTIPRLSHKANCVGVRVMVRVRVRVRFRARVRVRV